MRYTTLKFTRFLVRINLLGRNLGAEGRAMAESACQKVASRQRLEAREAGLLVRLTQQAAFVALAVVFVPSMIAGFSVASATSQSPNLSTFHVWGSVAFGPLGAAVGNVLLYTVKKGILQFRYRGALGVSTGVTVPRLGVGMVKPYDFWVGSAIGVFLFVAGIMSVAATAPPVQ